MFLKNLSEVPVEDVEEGAKGVRIRWLITEAAGATNFSMRHFEVDPGGCTPRHRHDWEHEVFVLAGEGHVLCDDETRRFKKNDVIFVAPGEMHQFTNDGTGKVELLCLIPLSDKDRE